MTPALKGLTLLCYQEPLVHSINGELVPTPQMILGSDGELPRDSVETVVNYLVKRLMTLKKTAVYSDPVNGAIEVYDLDPTSSRMERIKTRFSTIPFLYNPGRIYVTEQACERPSTFLKKLSKELSKC